MNNPVLMRVVLTANATPMTPQRLVATFTLVVPPKNSEDSVLSDGKGGAVDLLVGAQYRFEKVNLAELSIRGKAGEEVFVIGHTA